MEYTPDYPNQGWTLAWRAHDGHTMEREAELREFWAARGVQLEEKRASVITAIQHSVENLGGFREVSVNGAWSQVAEAIAWDGMWSDVRRAYLRCACPSLLRLILNTLVIGGCIRLIWLPRLQKRPIIAYDLVWHIIFGLHLYRTLTSDFAPAKPVRLTSPRCTFSHCLSLVKSASSSACPICNAVAILSGGALECSQCHSLFHSKCDGPSAQELSVRTA